MMHKTNARTISYLLLVGQCNLTCIIQFRLQSQQTMCCSRCKWMSALSQLKVGLHTIFANMENRIHRSNHCDTFVKMTNDIFGIAASGWIGTTINTIQ